MTGKAKKTILTLSGVALAVTVFMLRGVVPELVRYMRIRRM